MKTLKQSNLAYLGPGKLLSRLLLLTAVKEGYLFLANSYGFLFHPYLTVRRISSDHSQISIFTSLWLVSWSILLIIGTVYLFINDWSPFGGRLFWWGVIALTLAALILLVVSGYLVYWIIYWWRKKLHKYRQER